MPQINLNDDPLDEPDQPVDDPVEEDTPTRPRRRRGGESSSKGKEAVAESIFIIEEAKLAEISDSKERREKLVAAKLKHEEVCIRYLTENEKNSDLNVLLQPHNNLDKLFK